MLKLAAKVVVTSIAYDAGGQKALSIAQGRRNDMFNAPRSTRIRFAENTVEGRLLCLTFTYCLTCKLNALAMISRISSEALLTTKHATVIGSGMHSATPVLQGQSCAGPSEPPYQFLWLDPARLFRLPSIPNEFGLLSIGRLEHHCGNPFR